MNAEHVAKHRHDFSKTTFGFWAYLMTDCVLFASLFATYAVLQGNTAHGPSGSDIFKLDYVLVETILLLVSSLTSGLALLALKAKNRRAVVAWLAVTFALGASFLGMELYEFSSMVAEGHSWQVSGFLSAYFTLVGTHGLHITIGLLWLSVLMFAFVKKGFTNRFEKRMTLFSLFWHFLDIIWIFIFTLVYQIGVLR